MWRVLAGPVVFAAQKVMAIRWGHIHRVEVAGHAVTSPVNQSTGDPSKPQSGKSPLLPPQGLAHTRSIQRESED